MKFHAAPCEKVTDALDSDTPKGTLGLVTHVPSGHTVRIGELVYRPFSSGGLEFISSGQWCGSCVGFRIRPIALRGSVTLTREE